MSGKKRTVIDKNEERVLVAYRAMRTQAAMAMAARRSPDDGKPHAGRYWGGIPVGELEDYLSARAAFLEVATVDHELDDLVDSYIEGENVDAEVEAAERKAGWDPNP